MFLKNIIEAMHPKKMQYFNTGIVLCLQVDILCFVGNATEGCRF